MGTKRAAERLWGCGRSERESGGFGETGVEGNQVRGERQGFHGQAEKSVEKGERRDMAGLIPEA